MSDDKIRYSTVGGATVVLTELEVGRAEWLCIGCRGSSMGSKSAATAREAANAHANTCRALPRD